MTQYNLLLFLATSKNDNKGSPKYNMYISIHK